MEHSNELLDRGLNLRKKEELSVFSKVLFGFFETE